MSELIGKSRWRNNCRAQCLATTSAAVLLVASGAFDKVGAKSDRDERPSVWIELGSQFERVDAGFVPFTPPFYGSLPSSLAISAADSQRPSRYSFGGEGKLSFEPENSRWIYSASVRYGRSNSARHIHHQTVPEPLVLNSHFQITRTPTNFSDVKSKTTEDHSIVDFEVGRDVGLGIFGAHGASTMNLGVRFAQFHAHRSATIQAVPDADWNLKYVSFLGASFPTAVHHHSYQATVQSDRSLSAIGPSFSWEASEPIVTDQDEGGVSLDWGINASVLFGRQKSATRHKTKGTYHYNTRVSFSVYRTSQYQRSAHPGRARSVVVPNVGGYAAISYRFPNARLSLGYRGDFFFGAMDGGIDTQKSFDRNFHGPYAAISIGLGG